MDAIVAPLLPVEAMARYVNRSEFAAADVPAWLTTVTSTTPGGPAGVVTTIELSLVTLIEVAGIDPNKTLNAPIKWLPVIVTLSPPDIEPVEILSPETMAGGFVKVN